MSPGCVRRPAGVEPGQRPEFEQITVVLRGMLRVEYEGGILDVPRRAGGSHGGTRMDPLPNTRSEWRRVHGRMRLAVRTRERTSRFSLAIRPPLVCADALKRAAQIALDASEN